MALEPDKPKVRSFTQINHVTPDGEGGFARQSSVDRGTSNKALEAYKRGTLPTRIGESSTLSSTRASCLILSTRRYWSETRSGSRRYTRRAGRIHILARTSTRFERDRNRDGIRDRACDRGPALARRPRVQSPCSFLPVQCTMGGANRHVCDEKK